MLLSIHQIGFTDITDMLSTYAGRAQDMKGWLQDAAINRDRNLRLQYLAGMGLNLYESASIYSNMLAWRKFPDGLFIAPDEQRAALWQAIQTDRNRDR
jgi:spermidine synthase